MHPRPCPISGEPCAEFLCWPGCTRLYEAERKAGELLGRTSPIYHGVGNAAPPPTPQQRLPLAEALALFPLPASSSAAARALAKHPEHCCRWPLGDGWCSRAATHRSYCEQHWRASRAAEQREPSPAMASRWLRAIGARISRQGKKAA